MKIIIFTSLLMFFSNTLTVLDDSRLLFFQFDADKTAPDQLQKLLKTNHFELEPVLSAYLGVAIAAKANMESSPVLKLNKFNEGKALVEQALEDDPTNAEIRLLRLSIQTEAPSFLSYNSNIEGDKRFIIQILKTKKSPFNDNVFRRKVLIFLQKKVVLSPQEKYIVANLLRSA